MNGKWFLYLKKRCVVLFLFIGNVIEAQSVDLDTFKGNPFKINGGITIGSTLNLGNDANRSSFLYNLSGNMNLSFYSFSMPVSYNYSNTASQLNYQVPYNFNRLSLSPKYKWITAHIGDANMSFSPYTLSGHQFTGFGIELSPKYPLKFSAMYGRLLKEVVYDGNPNTLPSYGRIGYGTKLTYEIERAKVEMILFYATDEQNSNLMAPNSIMVTPKKNFVWSLSFESQLTKTLNWFLEYANSIITEDTRLENTENKWGYFFEQNSTTKKYNAIKTGVNLKLDKLALGGSYERIDPNYRTLGAYFFINDMENILFNSSNSLLQDKITFTASTGIQRDNLANTKNASTNRVIGNLSIAIKPSEQFMTNLAFNNQSTTTNTRPNQFDEINQINPNINSLERLRSNQLSQNTSLNTNFNFKPSPSSKKSIGLNYSFNQVANEQGKIIRIGQLSDFHNAGFSFNYGLIKSKWNFTGTFNYTKNTIAKENTIILGPMLNINKKIFNEKCSVQFSSSYNTTEAKGNQAETINFRLNTSIAVKGNHNFSLNASHQIRNIISANRINTQESIIIFGYAYNFNPKKKKT